MNIGSVVAGLSHNPGGFGLSYDPDDGSWRAVVSLDSSDSGYETVMDSAESAVSYVTTQLDWSGGDPVDISVIIDGLRREGGGLSLSSKVSRDWMVMMVFGTEAPDSPMAGGATHGVGETAEAALQMAVGQTGWARRVSAS